MLFFIIVACGYKTHFVAKTAPHFSFKMEMKRFRKLVFNPLNVSVK